MDFDMLGLKPRLIARIAELGLNTPTPIQAQAIPHAMNGRDVMGLAQTGTGKTAAFGLPLLHALDQGSDRCGPKAVSGLILAPTRELAKQILDNLTGFAKGSGLRLRLVVGGASINKQIQGLAKGTDLLVATPGRLIDLLDRKALTLSATGFLVLDEADQMLDLGFIHALRRIAPLLPKERQTMLFSATMPKQMNELAATYLKNPIRIEVTPPGKPVAKIKQGIHFVGQSSKQSLLIELLGKNREGRALVFSRTKHGAERLMKNLDKAGFAAGSIHGNKSQGQRERAIKAFRSGELRVLVATDVAARGIDIPGIEFVYNYDLPNVPENYVHRIGRTARAGAEGQAVAFCAADEMGELRAIQKVMGAQIPVVGGSPWEHEEKKPARGGQQRRRAGGGGGGGKPRGAAAPKPNANGKPRRPRRSKARKAA